MIWNVHWDYNICLDFERNKYFAPGTVVYNAKVYDASSRFNYNGCK